MSEGLDPDYQGKLSDQELKQKLTEEYNQNKTVEEVKEQKFPTEIVDLPSKGLLYSKENPLSSGKVELKYMTAREEDILTTQSYIAQGVVIDKLLQSLVVGNGEGKPVKFNELLVGDKNAIMIAARLLGYGKDYDIEMNDPFAPGKTQKLSIDLSVIDNKELHPDVEKAKHKNRFSFTLPRSKRKVVFRLLNHGNEKRVEHQKKDELKKLRRAKIKKDQHADPTLSLRTRQMILSVDGNDDSEYLDNFVKSEMLALDARALRNYMVKMQPDVDLKFLFVSDETGDEKEMEIPIDVNFFWPDADI
tara:strand:+ start:1575 stop:2486 length:912 start_codon:yes stop_codon:yes gene_type:complete